jgi:hypothetical protein
MAPTNSFSFFYKYKDPKENTDYKTISKTGTNILYSDEGCITRIGTMTVTSNKLSEENNHVVETTITLDKKYGSNSITIKYTTNGTDTVPVSIAYKNGNFSAVSSATRNFIINNKTRKINFVNAI